MKSSYQKSYACSRAWRAKFLGAQQLTKKEKAMHFFYLYDNPDFRCLYYMSVYYPIILVQESKAEPPEKTLAGTRRSF